MSFEVRTRAPLDDDWSERYELMEVVAGRPADYINESKGYSYGCWLVKKFTKARRLREELSEISGVHATIREAST